MLAPQTGMAEPYHEAYCQTARTGRAEMPSGPPYSVAGLPLEIDIPLEGKIRLRDPETGWEIEAWSPTGDFTFSFGPYDPASQRLYIWGYWENGWVEVRSQVLETQEVIWRFGASGLLEPRLYEPIDDIEDVVPLQPSPATGVIFYQGYTAPHWLTGGQSYRVYKIDGAEMTLLRKEEARRLAYVGDDPITGMAVFWSAHEGWIWYDGDNFIEPEDGEIGPVQEIASRLFTQEDWASWRERYRFCVQLARRRVQ